MGLDDAASRCLREALLIICLVQQAEPYPRGCRARRQLAQPSGLIGVGPHQFLMQRAANGPLWAKGHARE